MKNLLLTLSLVAIFSAATTASAQDVVEDKNKEQNKYRTQNAIKTQAKEQDQNKTKTSMKTQTKGQHGVGFVDEDGDGYNDNAPDHDGDGIPNGQDADYDGSKARKGNKSKGFVDEDGDGVNAGNGSGIGTGSGSGECDGTGPKGKKKQGGKN